MENVKITLRDDYIIKGNGKNKDKTYNDIITVVELPWIASDKQLIDLTQALIATQDDCVRVTVSYDETNN